MTATNGNGLDRRNLIANAQLAEAINLVTNAFTLSRDALRNRLIDNRRDYDRECGYPTEVTPEQYYEWYRRFSIAKRSVDVLSKECFQNYPLVYESEDADEVTPFEEAWDGLSKGLRGEESFYAEEEGSLVWDCLERADRLSRVGRYGIILFGFDDVASDDGLRLPVKGMIEKNSMSGRMEKDPNGKPVPLIDQSKGRYAFSVNEEQTKGRKLKFLRVFPETLCPISRWEMNTTSPRFGQPLAYSVTFYDPREQYGSSIGAPLATREVHWTRVQHIADGPDTSTVFAPPVMEPILPHLIDLKKIYGASAEGFWQSCFSMLSFETQPIDGVHPEVDTQEIKDMMEQIRNGLQRDMITKGMTVKTVPPQVTDPTSQIAVQIQAICILLGIPQRIFMGSERGELASSQDDAAWNDRLRQRRVGYITPRIIVPFVDRLITVGVLPKPQAQPKPDPSIIKPVAGTGKPQTEVEEEEAETPFPPKKPYPVGNAFCATGEGGGVDPSCSPGAGSGASEHEEFKEKEAGYRGATVDLNLKRANRMEKKAERLLKELGGTKDNLGAGLRDKNRSAADKKQISSLLRQHASAKTAADKYRKEMKESLSKGEDSVSDPGIFESVGHAGMGLFKALTGIRNEAVGNAFPQFGKQQPDQLLEEDEDGAETEDEIDPFARKPLQTPARPQKTKTGYCVEWPDLTSQSDAEKAQVFATRMGAFAQYVGGQVESVLPPLDMMTREAGYDEEEAAAILEGAAQANEERMQEDMLKQQEEVEAGLRPDMSDPEAVKAMQPQNPFGGGGGFGGKPGGGFPPKGGGPPKGKNPFAANADMVLINGEWVTLDNGQHVYVDEDGMKPSGPEGEPRYKQPDKSRADPKASKGLSRKQKQEIAEGRNPLPRISSKYAERYNAAIARDEFTDYEDATIPIKDIVTDQGHIHEDAVNKYARGEKSDKPITAVEFEGKYKLDDGNHRVVAALARGEKTVRVKLQRRKGATHNAFHPTVEDEGGGEGKPNPFARNAVENVFCATGEGGGVDPSCSPGEGGGGGETKLPDVSKLEVVKPLPGSTGPVQYKAPDGTHWVGKKRADAKDAENEVEAGNVYRALGISAAETGVANLADGKMVLSKMVEGDTPGERAPTLGEWAHNRSDAEVEAMYREVGKHFVADALLANWDTIGVSRNNIVIKDGKPIRIDQGQALRYKGDGPKKASEFGPQVTELEKMLDQRVNKAASDVFKHNSEDDITRQIEDVVNKRDAILGAVKDKGTHDILKQRLDYLDKRAKGTRAAEKALAKLDSEAMGKGNAAIEHAISRPEWTGPKDVKVVREAIQKAYDKAEVTHNFDPREAREVMGFADATHVKNAYELGHRSKGYMEGRNAKEEAVLGADKSIPGRERGKYGAVNWENNRLGGAPKYGDAVVVFNKDAIKGRSTATNGNSFGHSDSSNVGTLNDIHAAAMGTHQQSGNVGNASAMRAAGITPPKDAYTGYTEVQIWKGLRFDKDTVKEIRMPIHHAARKGIDKLVESSKRTGIPVRFWYQDANDGKVKDIEYGAAQAWSKGYLTKERGKSWLGAIQNWLGMDL